MRGIYRGKLMSLDYYIKRAYENAKNKGFHKKDDELRDTFNFGSPDHSHFCNIAMIKDLQLIVTEISEAVEAIREGRYATDPLMKLKEPDATYTVDDWKETFEEEIADTFIRLFDFCGNYSIDIENFINFKMAYNESREYLHGKKL